jgi:outer membrane protein assembly factor BamB
MRNLSLLTITLILTFTLNAYADNWAHWRGDRGNSISENATPPTEWSSTKNVKWKIRLPGQGSGSPVIWEDKVYVVSDVPSASQQPQAARTELPAASQQQQRRSRSRGGRRGGAPLRVLRFTLFCFDRATGKELWNQVAVEAKPVKRQRL